MQRPFHLGDPFLLHLNVNMEALDMGVAAVGLACSRRSLFLSLSGQIEDEETSDEEEEKADEAITELDAETPGSR